MVGIDRKMSEVVTTDREMTPRGRAKAVQVLAVGLVAHLGLNRPASVG